MSHLILALCLSDHNLARMWMSCDGYLLCKSLFIMQACFTTTSFCPPTFICFIHLLGTKEGLHCHGRSLPSAQAILFVYYLLMSFACSDAIGRSPDQGWSSFQTGKGSGSICPVLFPLASPRTHWELYIFWWRINLFTVFTFIMMPWGGQELSGKAHTLHADSPRSCLCLEQSQIVDLGHACTSGLPASQSRQYCPRCPSFKWERNQPGKV